MNCFLLIGSRERKREKERGVRAKNEKKAAKGRKIGAA